VASSGLIVAFVVALWAAYFVPLVLRRYDEANKNSALDTEGPMRRVVTSNRSEQAEAAADSPARSASPSAAARPAMTRQAAQVAARRRRHTLLTLIAVLAIVAAVAGFGYLPLWSIAAPVALIVAWLVACRLMVRRELGIAQPRDRASKQSEQDRPSRAPRRKNRQRTSRWAAFKSTASSRKSAAQSPRSMDDEDTVIVNLDDIEPDRKHVMEDAPLAESALDDQLQIAVPSVGEGEMLWDPLPVTLPTYVDKPRAGRTVRTIDFSQPGTWTSGHVEGENVEFPTRPDGDENPDTARRAVGH